jgi:hypothetical protein
LENWKNLFSLSCNPKRNAEAFVNANGLKKPTKIITYGVASNQLTDEGGEVMFG